MKSPFPLLPFAGSNDLSRLACTGWRETPSRVAHPCVSDAPSTPLARQRRDDALHETESRASSDLEIRNWEIGNCRYVGARPRLARDSVSCRSSLRLRRTSNANHSSETRRCAARDGVSRQQ